MPEPIIRPVLWSFQALRSLIEAVLWWFNSTLKTDVETASLLILAPVCSDTGALYIYRENMINDERDGVNRLLKFIGENTVASLSEQTLNNNADAEDALDILRQYTSEVQEQGVYINTEKILLSPDTNKKITLPKNTLNVTATGRDTYRNLVQRKKLLYDIDNNTYLFDSAVEVEITLELDFDELPESVKSYIIMRAVITFIINKKGDSARLPYTENQLNAARAALDKTRNKNIKPNMLHNNLPQLGRFNNNRL